MPSGGKRSGAGRKPNKEKNLPDPLVTASFRVDKKAYAKAQSLHGKKLSEKVNAFIKRLSKETKAGNSKIKQV